MKKSGRALVALVVLALAFGALWLNQQDAPLFEMITPPTDLTTTTTTVPTAPPVDVPLTLLGNGYAYMQLPEKQQENYTYVLHTLYTNRGFDSQLDDGEYGIEIGLPHALEHPDEVEELFQAVLDDHPELFYLRRMYGWRSMGKFYTAIRLFYLWDVTQRAQKATELEAAVSSLVTQAQGLTAPEQELLFHDAIVERCVYNEAAADEAAQESEAHAYASTAYAALVGGDPICGGYSRAFELLLSRVGIPNTSVDNEDHTWTMVWLDGVPYHVDVTWDDPVDGKENHDYFNLTDAEILATREYPAQERAVPTAVSTAHNYHEMNGWYFTDAFDEELDDCIREQIESGTDMVELKFAPTVHAQAVAWLIEDDAYYDAVYELYEDTLRDVWYGAILYSESAEIGTIRIWPDIL